RCERGCEGVSGETQGSLETPMNISHKGTKLQNKAQRKAGFFFVPSSAALRLCVKCFFLALLLAPGVYAQTKPGSHSSHPRASMSAEAKALLDQAIAVVCTQAKLDPKSSIAIDEMQARPSLPLQSPEARASAERAQRLLPITKTLMIASLEQLANDYGFQKSPKFRLRIKQAIARVNSVQR